MESPSMESSLPSLRSPRSPRSPRSYATLTLHEIARLAHETNRAYCAAIGDPSQPAWEDAPEWQRQSALKGVVAVAMGHVSGPRDSHEAWMRTKLAEGWTYGPVKDAEARTHPSLVPYEELPAAERRKDHLFLAVVRAALRDLDAPFAAGMAWMTGEGAEDALYTLTVHATPVPDAPASEAP